MSRKKRPDRRIASNDAGADSQQRDRYQAICAANECLALLKNHLGLESVFCEQEDDILVRTVDERFYCIQVKTERDALLRANDKEKVVKPIANFVRLEREYPDMFIQYRLVTNHGFENVTGKQAHADLKRVLKDVAEGTATEIADYTVAGTWWKTCFDSKDEDLILTVLKKMAVDQYGDFAAAENDLVVRVAEIPECSMLPLSQVKSIAMELIAAMERRSAKDLRTAERHLSLYAANPHEAYERACVEQRRMTGEMLQEIIRKVSSQYQSIGVSSFASAELAELRLVMERQNSFLQQLQAAAMDSPGDGSDALANEMKRVRDMMDEGRYKDAERDYESLLVRARNEKSEEKIRKILINRGVCQLNRDDLVEAESSFKEALKVENNDCLALANLAQLYTIKGQFTLALTEAKKAIATDSRNEFAACVHLMALQLTGNDGLEEYRRANEWLLQTANGLLVFGQIAVQQGNLSDAESYFRQALEKESENPQAKLLLAEVLYRRLDRDQETIAKYEFSNDSVVVLKEIVKYFNDALTVLKSRDPSRAYVNALINRASVLAMLDRLDDALPDLDEALKLMPNDPDVLRMNGSVRLQQGNTKSAIEFLRKARAQGADVTISLAAALHAEGAFEEAVAILREHSLDDNSARSLVAMDLLATCFRELKDNENLQKIISIIRERWIGCVDGQFIYAHQLNQDKREDEAIEILSKMISDDKLTVTQRALARTQLGHLYYHSEKFSEAIEQFNAIDQVEGLRNWTLPFKITALANVGSYKEAYELAQSLRIEDKAKTIIREVEAFVAMYIGDFAEAEKLYRNLISLVPNDTKYRLCLIRSILRQNRTDEGKHLLASIDESAILRDPQSCAELASIYAHLNEFERSIYFAYEAFRREPNDPRIYSLYVSVFVNTEGRSSLLEAPDLVSSGTTVILRQEHGKPELTFTVLGDDERSVDSQEIKAREHLGSLLAGKRKGDEILVGGSTRLVVRELKSKYVHAFQKALLEFGTRFPGETAIQAVSEHQEARLLASVDSRAKWVQTILAAYERQEITFGRASEGLGCTAPEFWCHLVKGRQSRFLCFDGDDSTLNQELEFAKADNAVLDTSALLTLAHLDMLPQLIRKFKEIFVPTFVLDELSKALMKSEYGNREKFYAVKHGDAYRMVEGNQSAIEADRRVFEQVRDFVMQQCTLLTSYECLAGGKVRFEQLCDRFGTTGLIACAIAVERPHTVFYSDDWLVRASARNIFRLRTTWIVPVLKAFLEREAISRDQWHEAIIKLALSSYSFMPIRADDLYWCLSSRDMQITEDVRFVFRHLEDKTISNESLVRVLAGFLRLVWINISIPEQRLFTLDLVAAVLVARKAGDSIVNYLFKQIDNELSLGGLASYEIKQQLNLSIKVMRVTV